jgi:hypothetical protein
MKSENGAAPDWPDGSGRLFFLLDGISSQSIEAPDRFRATCDKLVPLPREPITHAPALE